MKSGAVFRWVWVALAGAVVWGGTCAAGWGGARAATVGLGGVRHASDPGFSISREGTDRHGQYAAAAADETIASVFGVLVGPNWPPFLSAGYAVQAETRTGHPLGTHYTVNGVAPGSELTFVWRIHGHYSGEADAQAFRIAAAWGLYNGRNLWLGNFDGLSFVDTTPAAGGFAGRNTGTFGCAPNANSWYDGCGSEWNALGERLVSVRDAGDEGWLAAKIEIGGSGQNTVADYSIELMEVLVDDPAALVSIGARTSAFTLAQPQAAGGAYIQFDSGRRLAITARPVLGVPEPALPWLLLAAVGAAWISAARRTARAAYRDAGAR